MSEMRKSAFSESYESDSPGIGLTVQHLVKGMSNMTVQELEHLRDSVNAELSYMVVDRSELATTPLVANFSDPNSKELATTPLVANSLVANCEELATKDKIPVSIGTVEHKPHTKNGRTYFYYVWRYYGRDGKKKSKYLSSSRASAIAKVERIGIPPDAQRY